MSARFTQAEVVAYLKTLGWEESSRSVDVAQMSSGDSRLGVPSIRYRDAQRRYHEAIEDAHEAAGITCGDVLAEYVRRRL